MKFEVQKRKTDFWTEEVDVRLPEKTKKKLRIAAALAILFGPFAVLFGSELLKKPETKTSPEIPSE